MIDRGAVFRVSGWAVTDQRDCPRGHAEGCVGTAHLGLLLQLVCSVLRNGAFTATGRRLDQFVENVGLDADVVMLPSGGGRGERFRVLAQPEVQDRRRVEGTVDVESLTALFSKADGGLDDLSALFLLTAVGREVGPHASGQRRPSGTGDHL